MRPLIEMVSTVLLFTTLINAEAPCIVNVDTLTYPQPVYFSRKKLLAPSDDFGNINIENGQVVTMECPGNFLVHRTSNKHPVQVNFKCHAGIFLPEGWLPSGTAVDFASVNCLEPPSSTETNTNTSCAVRGTIITVGLEVANKIRTIITSCVDLKIAEVLYVKYDQAYNDKCASLAFSDHFKQGSFFPTRLNLQYLYSQNTQMATFNTILGNANRFVHNFLTRGHLAARADFVFSPAQMATYTFVNVAPQWISINEGNWNTLEMANRKTRQIKMRLRHFTICRQALHDVARHIMICLMLRSTYDIYVYQLVHNVYSKGDELYETNLRKRIAAKSVKTRIYTGTWGILQLKDNRGTPTNIYLSPLGRKIPVPLWFYKVVHDLENGGRATAFLGLNNPFLSKTEADAEAKKICPIDKCDEYPSRFNWVGWQKTDTVLGYSTCCTLDDFRKTVDHLPPFKVRYLFY